MPGPTPALRKSVITVRSSYRPDPLQRAIWVPSWSLTALGGVLLGLAAIGVYAAVQAWGLAHGAGIPAAVR